MHKCARNGRISPKTGPSSTDSPQNQRQIVKTTRLFSVALMLLAIADFADDEGVAYPAVSTLAEKCRMKPRNAQVILSSLRQAGELEVRENEGPRGTNLYRITLVSGVQRFAGGGVQTFTGAQILAGVQGTAQGGAKVCAEPLQGIAPKPSLNHHEPPPCALNLIDSLFGRFWKAYPRKVGKKKAEQAFRKLKVNEANLELMLTALATQSRSAQWVKDGGRYIPHPVTWLHQERWNDDIGESASPSQTNAASV